MYTTDTSNFSAEGWNAIQGFTPGIKCHVCESEKDVKSGRIVGIPGDIVVAHWQLCLGCHNDNWSVATNPWSGNLHYTLHKEKVVLVFHNKTNLSS